uniref:Uncharacterized protein n=1 Tax=Panagrolaimus sp. PS1159 TaxID=55785 RepID=A0AC35EVC8_9BILA
MRKVVFNGNIKSAVTKYLGSKNETFANKSNIFDDQCVYYPQQHLIMNCLQPEPTKRSTAAELLRHRLFMDLRDHDMYKIPLNVTPAVAPEDL